MLRLHDHLTTELKELVFAPAYISIENFETYLHTFYSSKRLLHPSTVHLVTDLDQRSYLPCYTTTVYLYGGASSPCPFARRNTNGDSSVPLRTTFLS